MISIEDRQKAVTLIAEACQHGASCTAACGILGISIRTHQRWTREGGVNADQRSVVERPRPANALTAEEEACILAQCHRPEFADLPPDQIVVRLMDEERLYLASVSSFYRVLRKHGELAHRGRTKARKTYPAPTTHHATSPNQVWSWDCTWLPGPAKGTYYYLVMILDIFSRKVVGWEVFLAESAENSRTVIERAVLSEKIINQPLALHSDNGSPFKGVTLLEKLRDLQIAPSFSRPRVSNDNAFSEALFKTCKYVPGYPASGFTGLTEARQWVHSFAQWYNYTHRHSALRYVTPAQRHSGEDTAILAQRHSLNQAARAAKPERWSGNTRNWTPAAVVTLNPERKEALVAMEVAA